jgi:hypothetical protein
MDEERSDSTPPGLADELPLSTVESFIAALVEAGPEVAEHMVRAANELLLAAQALTVAAERRLAEQRRLRGEADARAAAAAEEARADSAPAGSEPVLRSVDGVA